jgi:hypothetical protein
MPDFGDVDPNTGIPSARTQWEGSVDPLAPSVANGGISRADYDAYQRKRHRDALIGILSILGGTSAASGLASMFGGTGAAGSMLPGNAALSTAFPAEASLEAAGSMLPGAAALSTKFPTDAATEAGTGAVRNIGGGNGTSHAMSGMSGSDWAALAAALTGTVGGVLASNNQPSTTPSSATTDPNMAKLIQMMQGRLDKSEPLYDSIMAMANGLLPTQYQRGGG